MASSNVIGLSKPILSFFLGRTENLSVLTLVYWILRIGTAMNFMAHGLWGILGRESWNAYFLVANIGPEAARPLAFQIGLADFTAGVMILLFPLRALLLYMIIWGAWTALLRPLSGDPWWHWFERAGNYGVPLALMIMIGFGEDIKDMFSKARLPEMTENRIKVMKWTLRLTLAGFMIAHGGFAAIDGVEGKGYLVGHWASVGLPGPLMGPEAFLTITGIFEISLGILVLIRPFPPLILFIMVWKIFTELLFTTSGLPASEHHPYFNIISTVERGGMFAGPLALFVLLVYKIPGLAESVPTPLIGGLPSPLRKIVNFLGY